MRFDDLIQEKSIRGVISWLSKFLMDGDVQGLSIPNPGMASPDRLQVLWASSSQQSQLYLRKALEDMFYEWSPTLVKLDKSFGIYKHHYLFENLLRSIAYLRIVGVTPHLISMIRDNVGHDIIIGRISLYHRMVQCLFALD
ncbi:hypothetical protein K8T06_13375, partial [bacterium]|nr:hypothetical protein [bacterium]